VSRADAGSGVLAFAIAALALGFANPKEPASRVLSAAITLALAALVVDVFVL